MESDTFDRIDLEIIHALQLDARLPFQRIAAVIGISDQTVARRYARMRAAGSLRVLGFADPVRLGRLEWVVRIRCTPDSAAHVATELARRPEVPWISGTSGGTELVCITSAPGPADELLLKSLPRSARILDVAAHCLLHTYFGRRGGIAGRIDALTADQIARLQPVASPVTTTVPAVLDDTDRQILAALRVDGRAPVSRLAADAGMSPTAVQRRVAALRADGVLSFDVDTERARLGVRLRTLLWLTVAPAGLAGTGETLATHPEVAFVAAVTGDRNLYASIATPDVPGLYAYLTTRIAVLPAVRSVESSLVLHTVKGP